MCLPLGSFSCAAGILPGSHTPHPTRLRNCGSCPFCDFKARALLFLGRKNPEQMKLETIKRQKIQEEQTRNFKDGLEFRASHSRGRTIWLSPSPWLGIFYLLQCLIPNLQDSVCSEFLFTRFLICILNVKNIF